MDYETWTKQTCEELAKLGYVAENLRGVRWHTLFNDGFQPRTAAFLAIKKHNEKGE